VLGFLNKSVALLFYYLSWFVINAKFAARRKDGQKEIGQVVSEVE
jgi:hypothetical protein